MKLTSADFHADGEIPIQFTCDGENISPRLSWTDVPSNAKSFVLILHDPDAPRPGGFTHWIVYHIPSNALSISGNVPKTDSVAGVGLQGANDSGEIGYMGPCPPSGTHHYIYRLYAVDKEPGLKPGASCEQVMKAIKDHILEYADLSGTSTKR